MKKIIGIFVIFAMAGMTFVSCDPVENRNVLKGNVSEAEINQYVKIEQESRGGKLSNYFSFKSEPLNALTTFKHGLGTYIGCNTNGFIQCYVVPGKQKITLTVLNPDGSMFEKTYEFTVEECFNVAPEWALFCGTGSKTWEWDVSKGANMYGMGDALADEAGWWCPTPEERVPNEGVGATMTLTASGAELLKNRTNGTKEVGSFGFDIKKTDGFNKSMGIFTTANATVLAAKNTKGGEVETKFHIIRLNDKEIHLLVIDMDKRDEYKPDKEGWGQATHWLFRAK